MREMFKQRLGDQEPDNHFMCYADGRLVILATSEIVFFKPLELAEGNNDQGSETIVHVERSRLKWGEPKRSAAPKT